MLFWTTVKVGLRSLLASKMRSFLTMLGVIIGVGSVIAMLALGAGARQQVMAQYTSMGLNLMFISAVQLNAQGVAVGPKKNLKPAHAQALLHEVEAIHRISPFISGSAQIKYYNQNTTVSVNGVSDSFLTLRNCPIDHGRSFTGDEVDAAAKVCAIGSQTAVDLFGEDDPLSQTVKIKSLNFRVVAVLASKGDQGWANPDTFVYVPYTTAMQDLFGVDYVQELYIELYEGVDQEQVRQDVRAVLRRLHHLQSDQLDDFRVRFQTEWQQAADEATRTFAILLGGIASISLLVGGIGIMNIMLVTVTERTKEIGIRKAVGAKERSILLQFLLEALIISGLGGLVGVVLGVGGALALSRFTEFVTLVTPLSILLALSFAGLIGVFFGYYPARRAASLDPVEALRYE
jgi:putative ABC transport system permease protein